MLRATLPAGRPRCCRRRDRARSSPRATLKEVSWSPATVVDNRPASADGSVRLLTISVSDPWNELKGTRRGSGARHEAPRWLELVTQPGQLLALHPVADGNAPPGSRREQLHASTLVSVASSPYAVHAASANLDAALVELCVDHGARFSLPFGGGPLCSLEPGSQLLVSTPLGVGFASLFTQAVSLASCLEQGRPLLLLGWGAAGDIRAAADWQPVAAHVGVHGGAVFLSAPRLDAAPFVPQFDSWRAAGFFVSLTSEDEFQEAAARRDGGTRGTSDTSGLEEALFRSGHRLSHFLGGAPCAEAAALLSGLPPDVRRRVTRELTAAGFAQERLLFAEP